MKTAINRVLRRFNCEIHGLGYLSKLAKGEFKTDAFDAQAKCLAGRSVRTIFDVGANRGHISQRYRRMFPEANLYAFEPFQDTYAHLKQAAREDGRIHPIAVAVSNEVGTATFHVNQSADTNSLLASAKTASAALNQSTSTLSTIQVPTTTIDVFCKEHNLEAIDVLKLDIQGGELQALQGGASLLARRSVQLVYAEVSFSPIYEKSPLFHDIAKYLHDFGYALHDIFDPYYVGTRLGYADAIFLSPDLSRPR